MALFDVWLSKRQLWIGPDAGTVVDAEKLTEAPIEAANFNAALALLKAKEPEFDFQPGQQVDNNGVPLYPTEAEASATTYIHEE